MLRASPASSMQKTYDDCYLICSTAIYFEKHNNEAEALRSWREALDQIYYHNAYRVPANYRPKTETERALQESLREMELQCKERVDLLDALNKSRKEAGESSLANGSSGEQRYRATYGGNARQQTDALGDGTVPAVNYPDLARPPPVPQKLPIPQQLSQPYPRRPSNHRTSEESRQQPSLAPNLPPPPPPRPSPPPSAPASALPTQPKKSSRTPSPDKRSGRLRPTLRKEGDRKSGKTLSAVKSRPPAAAQAATLAWPNGMAPGLGLTQGNGSSTSLGGTSSLPSRQVSGTKSGLETSGNIYQTTSHGNDSLVPPPPADTEPERSERKSDEVVTPSLSENFQNQALDDSPRAPGLAETSGIARRKAPPPPPPHRRLGPLADDKPQTFGSPAKVAPPPDFPVYRKEYPTPTPIDARKAQSIAARRTAKPAAMADEEEDHIFPGPSTSKQSPNIHRKAVPSKGVGSPNESSRGIVDINNSSSSEVENAIRKKPKKTGPSTEKAQTETSEMVDDEEGDQSVEPNEELSWDERVAYLMKNLPKGVDEQAAKAIFNEIVIKGDEVHWEDVAGLEAAKNALKEAVVYPFLRPDLFMGLREPARGMLLFGPPGTGKTMLARAVATESKSTFFAISASSLTSKFLGESEKLVRALFALAKKLAPSIIFVDEIDSLLSTRSGTGEHEATRRIKTEFLIQWSDLAKAAAGREPVDKEGDATRVLVLAATNMPWAIDDAARRRFVRRQYIPLPEDYVREDQLRRLLSAQKHNLSDEDLDRLVDLTDGFSGSDITALAKDSAMGPLRSLGEKLLHMSPDDIRPILFEDFESSLVNIRPSVSKNGLKEFEEWAREFGERAG